MGMMLMGTADSLPSSRTATGVKSGNGNGTEIWESYSRRMAGIAGFPDFGIVTWVTSFPPVFTIFKKHDTSWYPVLLSTV